MAAIRTRIRGTAVVFVESFGHYIRHAPSAWFLQLVIFVVLAILFCAAQRKVARWPTEGKGESPYTAVFDHPYAAAVLIPLLLGSGPLWQASTLVRQAFNALAILPMIRLTRQVIDPKLIPALHALGILFASDTARQTIGGVPLLEQALLLLESSAGIAVVGRFLVQGERHPLHTPSTDGTARSHTPRMLGWLVLLALAGGFLAGVLGYLRLARLLVAGPLIAGFLGIMFYSVVRVLSGLLAFAMHVWPFRRLHMVQHHREFLAHRAHRLLIGAAVVAWVVRVLDYVGLLEPGLSLVGAALFTKLERGSLSISLGDVLAFVLVVWASYLFSALLRFVLREEVYPRTRIGSGLSYAINSLLQYLILTVGFLMWLAALGMDLNKVTVLAGALGVGIGFGLQSVVNNFVSGLILLFERPIHVGDTVEVGNLLGEVHHIGIRASKVRTRQGADIIVPNAQLVTDKLTNWTLGDRLRRIEVPVGMNYGATPSKVIEVLEQVAQAHPMVLRHPPPQALLMGYGDSSINYELRAWTDQFEDWRRIRSDLAVAVYDAVQQQVGMQFPFPLREVRLLRDTPDNDTEKPLPAIDAPVMTDERAQESEGCNGDVCTTNRGRNERKEKP
jgi:small-conductance mechanosensitive channel